jgi:hypothetical protein
MHPSSSKLVCEIVGRVPYKCCSGWYELGQGSASPYIVHAAKAAIPVQSIARITIHGNSVTIALHPWIPDNQCTAVVGHDHLQIPQYEECRIAERDISCITISGVQE